MLNNEILLTNKVSVGDKYKNYSDLCKHIGIPVTTGKQRQLDQRHLRCYFDWEKAERSNKLTITSTYYDNPKEFIDQRNGTHITPTIAMMMDLFLNTPWEGPFYSKSKMLYEMELLNDEIRKKADIQERATPRITVEKDYCIKILGHLNSTINQINKSGHGLILRKVVNVKTKHILPDELWDKYYAIRDKALEKFGEANERDIYRHKKWAAYRGEIDSQTIEQFNQAPIYERYQLFVFPTSDNGEPVSIEDFLNHIGEEMIKTYANKHKGCIGCVSPKAYEEAVNGLISNLLEEYLAQKEAIEAAEKEPVIVTATA